MTNPARVKEEATESQIPGWISPWGVSAFCLATLAIFSAVLLGNRVVSMTLTGIGLAAVVVGLIATMKERATRDWIWFLLAGAFNIGIMCVILFAGGLLNRYWEMDAPVAKSDPHKLTAIRRDDETRQARVLTPDERIDAKAETILQGDVSFEVKSVEAGSVEGRGDHSFLLVRCRVAGLRNEQPFTFEGFATAKHTPKLTAVGGKSYAFLEQRKRKIPAGAVVFLKAPPETVIITSGGYYDVQLVFELPVGDFPPLQLDIPASAWGREGVCKLQITGFFEPSIPAWSKQKN